MTANALPPVLFVADKFGYPGGVSSGATTYFLQVLPALVDAGVDLTVCFLREPHPAAEDLFKRGLQPLFLGASRMNPAVVLQVAKVAREKRCPIVHAAGIKATLMARAAVRFSDARVLVHVHDLLYPGWVISTLQRLFAQPADIGLCVSSAVRPMALRGYHVHPERLRVVPNGIELGRFRAAAASARARTRAQLGVPEDARVLAMVARMYPVKGHRIMLQMLPEIVRSCPQALLLLAGDGPERDFCERFTDEHELRPHVLFLGQRSDVPELLAASDVFLMPSQSEGLPLAGIEALAVGRPVVGFDVGGMAEVVDDGLTGRLVPHGDRDAFVAALVPLLRDGAVLNEYQARAYAAAERFSVARHVKQLIECYREAALAGTAEPQAHAGGRV